MGRVLLIIAALGAGPAMAEPPSEAAAAAEEERSPFRTDELIEDEEPSTLCGMPTWLAVTLGVAAGVGGAALVAGVVVAALVLVAGVVTIVAVTLIGAAEEAICGALCGSLCGLTMLGESCVAAGAGAADCDGPSCDSVCGSVSLFTPARPTASRIPPGMAAGGAMAY